MKMDVNFSLFCDVFASHGRSNQFSYQGLRELFNYLENAHDDYNLDVIELCCEYAESPIEVVLKEYNLQNISELEDQTEVIVIDDETIIYRMF